MTHHRIVSGEEPMVGLRVFTNDWTWGTITQLDLRGMGEECGTYCQAWHDVQLDNGNVKIYNCDRLTTKRPE